MPKTRACNMSKDTSIFTPAVAELVAIGAAIGANCEPCFKHHYNEARKLGVSKEDMAKAVELADKVKCAPAQNMRVLVDKILGTDLSATTAATSTPTGCCSSKASKRSLPASGKCR